MAKTMGHTMRRYMGHKLYLATIAQRKATLISDEGADPSDVPFWADAPEPSDQDDLDVGDLAYYDDLACSREHDRALLSKALACVCTEEMRQEFTPCQWCDLASEYSDTYKDRNGFRPRHFATWTGLELWDAIHRLYAQPMHDD